METDGLEKLLRIVAITFQVSAADSLDRVSREEQQTDLARLDRQYFFGKPSLPSFLSFFIPTLFTHEKVLFRRSSCQKVKKFLPGDSILEDNNAAISRILPSWLRADDDRKALGLEVEINGQLECVWFCEKKRSTTDQEGLGHEVVFGQVLSERLESAGCVEDLLPHESGHPGGTVDAQQTSGQVDAGVTRAEVNLKNKLDLDLEALYELRIERNPFGRSQSKNEFVGDSIWILESPEQKF